MLVSYIRSISPKKMMRSNEIMISLLQQKLMKRYLYFITFFDFIILMNTRPFPGFSISYNGINKCDI